MLERAGSGTGHDHAGHQSPSGEHGQDCLGAVQGGTEEERVQGPRPQGEARAQEARRGHAPQATGGRGEGKEEILRLVLIRCGSTATGSAEEGSRHSGVE